MSLMLQLLMCLLNIAMFAVLFFLLMSMFYRCSLKQMLVVVLRLLYVGSTCKLAVLSVTVNQKSCTATNQWRCAVKYFKTPFWKSF